MNSQLDALRLADRPAKEAERLLARRFGFLDDTLKAQAHATLAFQRSAAVVAPGRRQRQVTPWPLGL
jgi:hypothetical protein